MLLSFIAVIRLIYNKNHQSRKIDGLCPNYKARKQKNANTPKGAVLTLSNTDQLFLLEANMKVMYTLYQNKKASSMASVRYGRAVTQ